MDQNKIIEALTATLEPSLREQSEAFLTEVQKTVYFVPQLLHIVMNSEIDVPIRQSGAIHMKNMITQFWSEEDKAKPGQPVPFSINENDKQVIRDNIVEAVIAQRDPIRVQLAMCISTMVKNDYPGRWPGIAEKIVSYFKPTDYESCMGSLICLYQLVKNFKYRESSKSKALNKVMLHNNVIPKMHCLCMKILHDSSKKYAYLQKQILKIFFEFTQFHLPMNLITRVIFAQWMDLAKKVIELPVPAECDNIEEAKRGDLIWWKCKKWAVNIMRRCFERYGSPGTVLGRYNDFAKWFLENCAVDCMHVLLMVLDRYVKKQFVSQKVLQFTLHYIRTGIKHAATWKCLEELHIPVLIKEVIFPLFGHSKEDQELWQDDPVEFIKVKYNIFEDYLSPTTAAESLLVAVVSKRKETLQMAMSWAVSVISSEDPKIRDQALHMIGVLGDVLLENKLYKNQVEDMMKIHVFHHFSSPHGFLRFRACWMVYKFGKTKFKDAANIRFITESLINMLNKDQELPVRMEAVIGLQKMLEKQSKGCHKHSITKEIMLPHIQQIFRDLLKLIRTTEEFIISRCLQDFVDKFAEEVKLLAVELTSHLGQTFASVIESSGASPKDKSTNAEGLLGTLDIICYVLKDQKVLCCIEGIIIEVIGVILKNYDPEYFVKMLSLIGSFTSSHVTQQMWTVLPIIYDLFKHYDSIDCFTNMMPALHNYITVDSREFMADESRMDNMFDMAKMVLNATLRYVNEEAEGHAVKLLEIMLLQFKDRPELSCKMLPLFLDLIMNRLSRPFESTGLRRMCFQVVLAAMFINPSLTLAYLAEVRLPNQEEAMVRKFLGQVLQDADCFLGLHDRKMFVLGICTLMSLPVNVRPANIEDLATKFLPSLIIIFKGLKKVYELKSRQKVVEKLENEDEDVNKNESEEEDVEELENEDEEDVNINEDEEDVNINEDEEDVNINEDEEDVNINEDEEDVNINEDEEEDVEKMENEDEEDGIDSEEEGDDEYYDEYYDEELNYGVETLLGSYNTLIDGENFPLDEYQMFRTVVEGIRNADGLWYKVLTQNLVENDHKQLEEIFRLAEQRKSAQESKKIE